MIKRAISATVSTVLCAIGLILLFGSTAEAATRTVSYRVTFRDDRTSCPTAGTGAVRPCNPGGYSDFVGGRFELWDRDVGGTDDYIGSYLITGTGVRTATFEWENVAHGEAETNPDVYLRVYPEVRGNSLDSAAVRAVNAAGLQYAPTNFNVAPWIATDCANGTTCAIATTMPAGGTTAGTDLAVSYMILDGAQRVVQTYRTQMHWVWAEFVNADETAIFRIL